MCCESSTGYTRVVRVRAGMKVLSSERRWLPTAPPLIHILKYSSLINCLGLRILRSRSNLPTLQTESSMSNAANRGLCTRYALHVI